MKTYEITIKPLSGFGTPLKGDTLFGHICWQAAYDKGLFGKSIDELLADYASNPFLIVSSAYPRLEGHHVFKRPDLPLDSLFNFEGLSKADKISKRKEYKTKKWLLVKERISSLKAADLYISDKELFERMIKTTPEATQRIIRKKGVKFFMTDHSQSHNTINRLTGTTGEGSFAPYAVEQSVYAPGSELVIFAGIAEGFSSEQLKTALQRIGETGFGKDASTGLGKFNVSIVAEINLAALGSYKPNACYTLSPCVPEKEAYAEMFFAPFTRFGRHGDVLAKSKNPFKNPVIMADEGAVFVPHFDKEGMEGFDVSQRPYIGTAVKDVSLSEPNAVTQGYSLYIPVRMEV